MVETATDLYTRVYVFDSVFTEVLWDSIHFVMRLSRIHDNSNRALVHV